MTIYVCEISVALFSFSTDFPFPNDCVPIPEAEEFQFKLLKDVSDTQFGPSFRIDPQAEDTATFEEDYTLLTGQTGTFTVSPNVPVKVSITLDGVCLN